MKEHRTFIICFVAVVIAVAGTWAAEPGVVNINQATAQELALLSGVGPVLAERIVEFRSANGAFQSAEELVAVKGIGDKTLERLLPYLTTDGETTLQQEVRLPRTADSAADGS